MAHHPASATPHDEPELSPAERYARARAARHHAGSELGRFAARVGFPLDDFQRRACAEVEDGHGVLVAAPTGAGKTVVGEFAVHLALARGTKAFYTTPIKALSNQKHADLARVHGAENVGLLTGDTSVNPDAPVVVMTTEVLRNMLYAQSDTLIDLGFVVMDEVHYLADRFRGPVWEEVIIHLPEHVQLISLSATVSNAEEFGAWLDTVRGATTVIVSEHRPVPLWQHVMAGGRLYDLFAEDIAFEAPPPPPGMIEPKVEALIEATGIDFRIGGDRAFYVPALDYVQVPPPAAYFEPINWHRTALHEMGHATGHASRLGRDFSGSFGTKKYAFEELVAEMNAAFCCASLGIVPTVRHADYIGSWLEVLREDNRAIVRAASQASKAADWLLSHLPDEDGAESVAASTERRVAA